ncbi:hypothetical protein SBV45_03530 [Chlamydia crocodili]|uniref:Uncharacterized protein n=2 Tax=Chlamydia/Chlamydophila group TaxID=1113537 RepID=A0ABX8CDR7_9CHLA|nr:hypothetical protein [Chlamydia crocodili]QVE49160.1 hypothetical protein H9Q19_00375 [Chlamydia crocodili]
MKLGIALFPHIDENDPKNFDPFITLLTFDELWEDYKHNQDKPPWSFYDAIITLLNKRSINPVQKYNDEATLLAFQYDIDKLTGNRLLVRVDDI